MKKIASLVSFALAAAGIVAGCAVESGDLAQDDSAGAEQAACLNLDGTNAMLATLAAAMGTELHRFELVSDFEVYRGYNYQEMLRIKQSARSLCTNNCRTIDAILSLQDSRTDQLFVFKDGTKLNSWTFASRLVTGWRNQKVCLDRAATDPRACVTEYHYLEKTNSVPTTCGGVDYGLNMNTYKVSKANQYGQKVSPETALTNPDILQRKLLWTDPDQTLPATGNPYLQFRILDSKVELELDPTRGGTGDAPTAPGTCGTTSLSYNVDPAVVVNGTCCSVNGSMNTVYKPYLMPGTTVWAGWYKCLPQ